MEPLYCKSFRTEALLIGDRSENVPCVLGKLFLIGHPKFISPTIGSICFTLEKCEDFCVLEKLSGRSKLDRAGFVAVGVSLFVFFLTLFKAPVAVCLNHCFFVLAYLEQF